MPGIVRIQFEALKLRKQLIVVEGKVRDGVGELIVGDQSHFVGGPKPRGNRGQTFLHLVGGLIERSLSIRTTAESGKGSEEK